MHYGKLKSQGYIPRLFDETLFQALKIFPALEIAGPMWCGKTWTSLAQGESVSRIGRKEVREVVENEPALALKGKQPHVIDEWQEVPAIWDVVRESVDQNPGKTGSYILTGSSSFQKEKVAHSGAGRISRFHMYTMSSYELGLSDGSVSIQDLFEGKFKNQEHKSSLSDIARQICKGGWPGLLKVGIEEAQDRLSAYLDSVLSVNVPKRGFDKAIAKKVFSSLARNNGTSAKLETIASDASLEGAKSWVTQQAQQYLKVFRDLFLIDEIPGWDAPIRSKSRLRTSPKRYLTDPSLVIQALGVDEKRLLEEGQLFGTLFENLAIHDLLVYASCLKGHSADTVKYYRDADGLEVDAIIELKDSRWGAFEIKLGDNKVPEAIKTLKRPKEKIAANPAARNKEPEFMAVIIGSANYSYYDKESGVHVIPLGCLKP